MSVRHTSFSTARVVTAFTLSRRAPSGGPPHDSDARPANLKVESARGVWRGRPPCWKHMWQPGQGEVRSSRATHISRPRWCR
ncbi:hypothetical protein CDEST_04520 [Colletotrichum destructivum]|uniref:Secreted protein n=1 Tax=Colletotrichum destructivum TaxID=34406 RepID=A0AAX4I819_9PEZI|nr:hypothetical protein CDEST_04520 [Colletotrichum destructivum]